MGSRIVINFRSLLNDPSIEVEIRSTIRHAGEGESEDEDWYIEHTAKVYFEAVEEEFLFDYSLTPTGGVELSRDFNFFRNEEEHRNLMRALYEHGVSFTVHH